MTQGDSPQPTVIPAGDAAVLVVFADEVSLEVNARVHALSRALEGERGAGSLETVPAYCTLLIHYDPLRTSLEAVTALVERLVAEGLETARADTPLREIPTVYGGAYGPDLPDVAQKLGMTEEEVIRLHSGALYTVYMLGFAPGVPYMGGLPPQLVMPRLESPRERVVEGTVAIANQATIYALTTPGGWRLIGRTPLKMFDPQADPPTYLQAGDRVRYVPITEEEYLRRGGEKAEEPPKN